MLYDKKEILRNTVQLCGNYYWFSTSAIQMALNSLYLFKYNEDVTTVWGNNYKGVQNATNLIGIIFFLTGPDEIVKPTYISLEGKNVGDKASKYSEIIIGRGPMCDLMTIPDCSTYYDSSWEKNAVFAIDGVKNDFFKSINSFLGGDQSHTSRLQF